MRPIPKTKQILPKYFLKNKILIKNTSNITLSRNLKRASCFGIGKRAVCWQFSKIATPRPIWTIQRPRLVEISRWVQPWRSISAHTKKVFPFIMQKLHKARLMASQHWPYFDCTHIENHNITLTKLHASWTHIHQGQARISLRELFYKAISSWSEMTISQFRQQSTPTSRCPCRCPGWSACSSCRCAPASPLCGKVLMILLCPVP